MYIQEHSRKKTIVVGICGCGLEGFLLLLYKMVMISISKNIVNKITVSKVSEWKMELLCFSIIVNMLKYNRNNNIFMHELVILKIYDIYTFRVC